MIIYLHIKTRDMKKDVWNKTAFDQEYKISNKRFVERCCRKEPTMGWGDVTEPQTNYLHI